MANNAYKAAYSASVGAQIAQSQAQAAEYLTVVLNSGSTDIQGGLILSNILALKDMNGNVTAGMCGLDKYSMSGTTYENEVLLWGGGTYNEAFAASKNNYQTDTNKFITTLMKKNGDAKIGLFEIDKDKAVVNDEMGYERVAMTSENIQNYILSKNSKPSQKTYKFVDLYNLENELPFYIAMSQSPQIEDSNYSDSGFETISYVDIKLKVTEFQIEEEYDGYNPNLEYPPTLDSEHVMKIYLTLPSGGQIEIGVIQIHCVDDSNGIRIYKEINDSNYDLSCTIDLQSYNIRKTTSNNFGIKIECSTLKDVQIKGLYDHNINFMLVGERKTVIGQNGISCSADNGNVFQVYSALGEQNIKIEGLPAKKPTEKNMVYAMSESNADLLSEIKMQSQYLNHVSKNLNALLIQFMDLLEYTDEFLQAYAETVTDQNIRIPISKIRACIAGHSSEEDMYEGIDGVKRFGLRTMRMGNKLNSFTKYTIPLFDLIGEGKQTRTQKKYLSNLAERSERLAGKTTDTRLLSLS